MPLMLVMSFRCLKQGQVNSLTLFFDATEAFIETHLADSLFAGRRWRDSFATGAHCHREAVSCSHCSM
jgi:hypothetical protein